MRRRAQPMTQPVFPFTGVVRAMGIDAGLAHFGVAVANVRMHDDVAVHMLAADVVETTKEDKKRAVASSDDIVRRGRELASRFLWLMDAWHPQIICAESISFPRSSVASLMIGIAWGEIIVEATRRGIPIPQLSPQRIRDGVGLSAIVDGKRQKVTKLMVEECCARQVPHARKMIEAIAIVAGHREHAWDALAAIIACRNTDVMRTLAIPVTR